MTRAYRGDQSPEQARAQLQAAADRLHQASALRRERAGPKPDRFLKPPYNTDAYRYAVAAGWINQEQEARDAARYAERRKRALETAHRYAPKPKSHPKPQTQAYVPEMAFAIDLDRNLRGSAPRLARFLMKEAYQKARSHRRLRITVSYIARGLNLSERHVQRLLRNLQEEGYLDIDVMISATTEMVLGLLVTLRDLLFPRHAAQKWPARVEEPAPTFWSDNENHTKNLIYRDRRLWAAKCMGGVKKAWLSATGWGSNSLRVPRGASGLPSRDR